MGTGSSLDKVAVLARIIHEHFYAIADRCYDEPSAGGLACQTLNVRLGTGRLS